MDNIKLDFQKHIDAGRCNGAEWIINHKNNIYHEVIGYKDLELKNKLNKNSIINPLTKKEAELIKASLLENSFRYDASELMERKIGADALWKALKNYIDMGKERAYREIEDITEELDTSF